MRQSLSRRQTAVVVLSVLATLNVVELLPVAVQWWEALLLAAAIGVLLVVSFRRWNKHRGTIGQPPKQTRR